MPRKTKKNGLSPFALTIHQLVMAGHRREDIHALVDVVIDAALPDLADAAGGRGFAAVQCLHRGPTSEDGSSVYPWPAGEDSPD